MPLRALLVVGLVGLVWLVLWVHVLLENNSGKVRSMKVGVWAVAATVASITATAAAAAAAVGYCSQQHRKRKCLSSSLFIITKEQVTKCN